ncbi:conserved hypothetical protein [Bacillus cereus Q1]|uniref:Uncharacterized protein n=2 Tax=Bacillus cereus TaxID=1396 RepID=Q72YA0_BACC1|nr:hypothetical protein BCE_5121 [Bacillus cereus ATCC 10987]ACM15201.1 conserved hypothetical protein [Bacillus cereus Q1]
MYHIRMQVKYLYTFVKKLLLFFIVCDIILFDIKLE